MVGGSLRVLQPVVFVCEHGPLRDCTRFKLMRERDRALGFFGNQIDF